MQPGNTGGRLDPAEINNRWGFHRATIEGPQNSQATHVLLRRAYIKFVGDLNKILPPGRYASLCWTAMEEASMWAHKAVASRDPLEDLPGETHTEETQHTVYKALLDSGLSGDEAMNAIREMQNKGILFRERA